MDSTSTPAVSETLSLLRLPEDIKDEVRTSELPKQILVELAREKKPDRQRQLFKKAQAGGLTVKGFRKERKPVSNKPKKSGAERVIAGIIQAGKSMDKLERREVPIAKQVDLRRAFNDLQKAWIRFAG